MLSRRVDHRLVDGVEGTLREGRERPYLLDLVAEQLDAQRLPARARKDVDQPSPHRDVPSVLDPLDPLVSGEGQRFDQTVQSRARTGRDADGVGASLDRRCALGERPGRHAHETALLEHCQRARPLADEMRWWLETRSERHAAAREERDASRIHVPGNRLRGVAGFLVLGEEADERSLESAVQRREQKRKHGLGHPGRGREVLHEHAEAIARGELGDESGKWGARLVHAAGGKRVPRGHRNLAAARLPLPSPTTPRGTPMPRWERYPGRCDTWFTRRSRIDTNSQRTPADTAARAAS